MRRLVVLGTGTAVGKTYVTAALARALAKRDPDAPLLVVKPIETGVDSADPVDTDAAKLAALCRHCAPPQPHPLYVLRTPVSPYRAATRENLTLDVDRIAAHYTAHIHDTTIQYTASGWFVAETAGGVFSPISRTTTNFELASGFGPTATWALVAPDALGVIHDVTATLTAMQARGRLPDVLLLSGARPPDASTGGNATELREIGVTLPILTVPRDGDAPAELADLLASLAAARAEK